MSNSLQPHGLYSPWNSPDKNTGVGSHSLLQGIFPTQESNPGLLHCRRILYYLSHQGSPRILEWVAYPFSRGFSQPRNRIWRRQWHPTPVILPGKSNHRDSWRPGERWWSSGGDLTMLLTGFACGLDWMRSEEHTLNSSHTLASRMPSSA